jgi:hypothetical protein
MLFRRLNLHGLKSEVTYHELNATVLTALIV